MKPFAYMQKIVTTLFLILFSLQLDAQNFKIEESSALDEIKGGWLKIIQLKNGNTATVHITYEEGMNVLIFDITRRLITQKNIRPLYEGNSELNGSSDIEGIYSINNDIVVFVSTYKKDLTHLFRITIDGTNGSLKDETDIGKSLDKTINFSGYSIQKDTDSDNYGIILRSAKRIDLVHYGMDHKIINRAFYGPDDNRVTAISITDFIVIGDHKLIACADLVFGNKRERVLAMLSLGKGSSALKTKQLDFTENKTFSGGLIRYNKQNDLLVMVIHNMPWDRYNRGREYGGATLLFVDALTLSVSFMKDVTFPNVNTEYKKIFGQKENYLGVLHDLEINQNGTYTLLYEQSYIKYSNSTSGVSTNYLEATAASVLNEKANETNAWLLPKSHAAFRNSDPRGDYQPLYISRRRYMAQTLRDGNNYKSFSFVNGKTGNYIFFNDSEENVENIKKGKLTTVVGISSCDAFVNTLSNEGLKKEFLFGPPKGGQHNYVMFAVSDYNSANGTYAALKVENNKETVMKVIWITL